MGGGGSMILPACSMYRLWNAGVGLEQHKITTKTKGTKYMTAWRNKAETDLAESNLCFMYFRSFT